jgi:hypothetical protein
MPDFHRLETHAEIIARHIDSPPKRRLVVEFLEDLHRSDMLTAREKARLIIKLLKAPG